MGTSARPPTRLRHRKLGHRAIGLAFSPPTVESALVEAEGSVTGITSGGLDLGTRVGPPALSNLGSVLQFLREPAQFQGLRREL
jgi:hypothetical protein